MKNYMLFAIDCLKGTKDLVQEELLKLKSDVEIFESNSDELVIFRAKEDYDGFKSLKRIVNLYYLLCFPVKGPGNLLNIKYLSQICLYMQKANKNLLDSKNEDDICKTFRINAAGSNSQTFKKLKEKIQR